MADMSQNLNTPKGPVLMDLDEIMNEVRALHQGLNQATLGVSAAQSGAAAPTVNANEPSIESIIEDIAQDIEELSMKQVAEKVAFDAATEQSPPELIVAAPVTEEVQIEAQAEVEAAPIMEQNGDDFLDQTEAVTETSTVLVEEELVIPMMTQQAVAETVVASEPAAEPFVNSPPTEASIEEMLVALKPEESFSESAAFASVTPIYEAKPETTGVSTMKTVDKQESDSALSIQLSGAMSVKLKYECDGQEVQISFSDHCLKVQFTDGTEFKIPVARGAKARQAA